MEPDGVATFDVCVVGAGMFGSAAARHAAADVRVCLVGPAEPTTADEWGVRRVHSSHYDEGRLVFCHEEHDAMRQLARESVGRFRELERMSGIEFYRPVGCLLVTEEGSREQSRLTEAARAENAPLVDLGNGDDFAKRFPFLRLVSGFRPFLDDSGAGYVSARRMVAAQQEVALARGCVLLRDVVVGVEDAEDGTHQVLLESGRVVRCRRVLVCAGAYTKFNGLMPDLKFSVHRENVALVRVPEEEGRRLGSMPPILVYKKAIADMPSTCHGVYILPPIQYPDSHFYLKIGPMGHVADSEVGSLEEVRRWYGAGAGDPETLEKLPRVLHALIPGLRVEGPVLSKTCVTADSPSGLPYIGHVTPSVTVAAVGNGSGAMVSEEVGRVAAGLAARGRWESALPEHLFRPVTE